MQIAEARLYRYELTYAHGTYRMSHGREITTLPSLVVGITTDTGLTGWGEVCPLGSAYLPVTVDGLESSIGGLLSVLIGLNPLDRAAVWAAMDDAFLGQPYAKSPIDNAVWDIAGQAAGQPVYELLGGRRTERMPAYWAVPLDSAEATADFIAARKAEGGTRFQLKLGDDPDDDLARIQACAQTIGPGDLVLADANTGWTRAQAISVLRRFPDDHRIILEQPCESLSDNLALAPFLAAPMVLDECILSPDDLVRAAASKVVAGVNLKCSRVGGTTRQQLMKEFALALGLNVSIEDMWGGDIATAQIAHMAATVPERNLMLVPQYNEWNNEHVEDQPTSSDNGWMAPRTSPGLGVQPNIERLGKPVAQA